MANRALSRWLIVLGALLVGVAHAGSFETYHPDQDNRIRGFEAYNSGKHGRALELFRKAARYADKPSQLAIAMMYWGGEGVAEDPALAYAWADLASERGYVDFLAFREKVWETLDATQQQRALDEGAKLYAEYGDDVAKRRLNGMLRQGLAKRTGSRAGSNVSGVAAVEVDGAARVNMISRMHSSYFLQAPAEGALGNVKEFPLRLLAQMVGEVGARTAGGYYDAANWQPDAYWQFQDAVWSPEGVAEVQPLRVPKQQ
jgi:hypothetical protein